MDNSHSENLKESAIGGDEFDEPHCQGCEKPIEDGSVVQFGDGIWHFECFRCAKCFKLVECYSNLLLLRDGSPICEDCSYSCHACGNTIKDEAIMTGEEAYHADCFRCIQCSKKIDDLVFTQTVKGIFCTKCYEARKQLRLKRKDEKNNLKRPGEEDNRNLLSASFRSSSTTSIVNAYVEDYLKDPVVDSREISELSDMLLGQRNSEELNRNAFEPNSFSLESDTYDTKELKRELIETRSKLKEVEGKFNKIKIISRKALDEFQIVKEGYITEVSARKEVERLNVRLKSEIAFYQQASIFDGPSFMRYTKEEIDELHETRGDLEQSCYDLRSERDYLLKELESHSDNIEKLLISQKPQDLHWERLQHAYHQQLDSMQKEISIAKDRYDSVAHKRTAMIADMEMLIKRNNELTQMNNDLSRKVIEREQEAKALIAGTNFLNIEDERKEVKKESKHRRNLSTGSIGIVHSNSMPEIKVSAQTPAPVTPKVAQRDSFNGSAAPKFYKFRRNKSQLNKSKSNKNDDKTASASYDTSHQPRSLEPVSESGSSAENKVGGKHHFGMNKFLRPAKCEVCGEKMWRVTELKCSECNVSCHSKCLYSVPQNCSRKNSVESNVSDDSRYMFGNDLVKQVQAEKGKIPLVVEKCIESVEARGMDYEGIYRKSGGVGQMRQIQSSFEKGENPNLIDEEKWNDICAVTSVLKQYFRELPNPLFTYELHSKYIDAIMLPDTTEQMQTMTQLIQMLPIENFNTLKYLMLHLYRIQERQKENLMTSKNIAVIFGPTLLRHKEENRDLLEMTYKIGVIEFILNNADKLFVIETLPSKSHLEENRKVHLPPVAKGEDLSTVFASYTSVSALPAVPPRQNAGYI
ncbi:hypothetical protein BY458DRAFT_476706 [Sporodiniella umbellata]|nr:hypothetical protein BY458DRAFT_476706 [Sporodiniella umbellata]